MTETRVRVRLNPELTTYEASSQSGPDRSVVESNVGKPNYYYGGVEVDLARFSPFPLRSSDNQTRSVVLTCLVVPHVID